MSSESNPTPGPSLWARNTAYGMFTEEDGDLLLGHMDHYVRIRFGDDDGAPWALRYEIAMALDDARRGSIHVPSAKVRARARRRIAWIEGMDESAALICQYCGRADLYEPPFVNEKNIIVHRTFSSRGLGSDHECRAASVLVARDRKARKVKSEVTSDGKS